MFWKLSVCSLAVALISCASEPAGGGPTPPPRSSPPPPPVTSQPLTCNTPDACRSLDAEKAARCNGYHTLTESSCGQFRLLVIETDPTSVTYTKELYYYDGTGRLVGRSTFVNEYGRQLIEGNVPQCSAASPQVVCQRK